MKTINDLEQSLLSHPNAGLMIAIEEAINRAKTKGEITGDEPLVFTSLEFIKQSLFRTTDEADPMTTLLAAQVSLECEGKANATELAIQYIEHLQEDPLRVATL